MYSWYKKTYLPLLSTSTSLLSFCYIWTVKVPCAPVLCDEGTCRGQWVRGSGASGRSHDWIWEDTLPRRFRSGSPHMSSVSYCTTLLRRVWRWTHFHTYVPCAVTGPVGIRRGRIKRTVRQRIFKHVIKVAYPRHGFANDAYQIATPPSPAARKLCFWVCVRNI